MKFSPAGATHFVPLDEHDDDQAARPEVEPDDAPIIPRGERPSRRG